MKTLRMIGMVVMTILMSVGLVSCSSSDDDEKAVESGSIVGLWSCPINRTWADTDVFEFKADGTVFEHLYYKSELVYEEKGTYVYANGKVTSTREATRELLDNGQWSSWVNAPSTVSYNVTIKGNKLTLTNSELTIELVRK